MTAKLYDLAEYRKCKKIFAEWNASAKAWEIYYDKHKHMCTSCDFWGLEQGTNKLGCTHKYRQFIEGCPLWRKP